MLVKIKIQGMTSLLQHRFGEQSEQKKSTRKILIEDKTPRQCAEEVVYRDSKGFYFPGTWIFGCLISAGSNHKMKGSRKSLRFIVPSAIIIPEEKIYLTKADGSGPVPSFEVDSRPVTIPATKGRIMRHRPRFDDWGASFTVEIDETTLPSETIHQLLEEGGSKIGIGDFRPEKRGPFGRFRVTLFKE